MSEKVACYCQLNLEVGILIFVMGCSVVAFTKKPGMEVTGDLFRLSFRTKGWMYYVLVFACVPVILKFLDHIRQCQLRSATKNHERSFVELFTFTMGLICQQGFVL